MKEYDDLDALMNEIDEEMGSEYKYEIRQVKGFSHLFNESYENNAIYKISKEYRTEELVTDRFYDSYKFGHNIYYTDYDSREKTSLFSLDKFGNKEELCFFDDGEIVILYVDEEYVLCRNDSGLRKYYLYNIEECRLTVLDKADTKYIGVYDGYAYILDDTSSGKKSIYRISFADAKVTEVLQNIHKGIICDNELVYAEKEEIHSTFFIKMLNLDTEETQDVLTVDDAGRLFDFAIYKGKLYFVCSYFSVDNISKSIDNKCKCFLYCYDIKRKTTQCIYDYYNEHSVFDDTVKIYIKSNTIYLGIENQICKLTGVKIDLKTNSVVKITKVFRDQRDFEKKAVK